MSECTLCGLPTPDPPVTADGVEGTFCCRGCRTVAQALDGEQAPADVDTDAALDTGPDPEATAGETAFLSVEGMHCATCEVFLEARATDRAGIEAADANYAAGLVRIVHDGSVDAAAAAAELDGYGYDVHPAESEYTADETGDNERVGRLLVGGFFGMMTMVWYALFLYPTYLGVPPEARVLDLSGAAGRYLLWNVWLGATVVLGYTGYPILRGAAVSLRAGRPNMDLLVALAATAAYAYSVGVLLTGGIDVYFDVSIVVVLAVSVGGHYESRIRDRATGRLSALAADRVETARRRADGGTETVAVDDVDPGEELVVRPGERIPVDGTVREGTAACDEALVTGESLPVQRGPGDEAVGGARVTDGSLVVRAGDPATSTADRLLAELWALRSSRAGVQRLADRLATVFVPLVLALAFGALGWHLLGGASVTGAVLAGLAVLVVSCPCALGLATPLAVAAGVRTALDRGVVVADTAAFERAPAVDVVALDKTGTLTTGEMAVTAVAVDGADRETVLARAAAVEQFSDHPVADAVVDAADAPAADVTGFERHPGRGVSAGVGGAEVVVGRRDLLADRGFTIPDALDARTDTARDAGRVPVVVGWEGRARGVLVAGDDPRPGWRDAVSALADGRRVVVLSGDEAAATERFGAHPEVSETFAGVPPEAKAEVVERLRAEGTVAMVGDGSNDAPALAAADVGVALGSRAHLATDAADLVVTTDDLAAVPEAFGLLGATRGRVRENIGWAFLYNAVAVPLAVAGLVNPLLAAVAMATSSLLVVANSARSLDGDQTAADRQPTESLPLEVPTPDP